MLTIQKETNFDQVKDIWKKLWEKLSVPYPFLSWEWQKTWWEVNGKGELSIYTTANNNEPIGTVAFRKEGKVIRWSSGEEVSDYLDLVTNEENKKDFWSLILQKLVDDRVEKIELRNIPQNSQTRMSLKNLSAEYNFQFKEEKEDVVPFIALPSTFNEYLLSLTRKDRHELRRKFRRFENETSKKWKLVKSTRETLDRDCQSFFRLFRLGTPKKRQFLTSKMEEFFCKVAEEMQNLSLLDLSALKIGDDIISQAMSFISGKTFYLYNSAVDPKFYYLSPGLILNKCLIEESIQKKLKIYDFMQGRERYKYQFGAKNAYVYKVTLNVIPTKAGIYIDSGSSPE